MRDIRRWTPLAAAVAFVIGHEPVSAIPVIVVTDATDSGSGSTCELRQAIQAVANGSTVGNCNNPGGIDTIDFASNLANATITLTLGQLSITAPTTINGSGQTIDAAGHSRVMYVSGNGNLVASKLTLTGGATTGIGVQNAGGGIYAASGAKVNLSRCQISDNSAAYGAGIAGFGSSTIYLADSAVNGNTGVGAVTTGGGVDLGSGTAIHFTRSTLSGNTSSHGGGLWTESGTATFVDSTVSGNSGTTLFAGIYGLYATFTLTNTTVSGNTSPNFGGGLFAPRSIATLTNSTVSGNSANGAAGVGGQVTGGSAANTITLINSIVANNTGGDCYDGAGTTTIIASNTLIGDSGSPCGITNGTNGNITGADPLLGALASNGGPTPTMALGAGSPALAAGDPAPGGLALGLNYDQRGFGFPRTIDGKIDMGAWQNQGTRIFADGLEPEP